MVNTTFPWIHSHREKIKLISIWLWVKFDQFQCPTKYMSLSTTHKQTSRQLHLSEPGRAIALPCTMEPRNKVYPCYFEFEGTLSELVISPPRWSSYPNWGGLWVGWQNWGWLWVRRPNWTNFIALCPPQRPTNYIVPKQIALILECKLNWMGPLYTSNWIANLSFSSIEMTLKYRFLILVVGKKTLSERHSKHGISHLPRSPGQLLHFCGCWEECYVCPRCIFTRRVLWYMWLVRKLIWEALQEAPILDILGSGHCTSLG